MKPTYFEVPPEEFESVIIKHPNQDSLDFPRDYSRKITFLADDGKSGYAIHESGELNHLFSLLPGQGSFAVQDAIARGAWHLNCFDGKLTQYYTSLGFQVFKREQNWTPGGPDVVFMRLTEQEQP